MPCDSASFLKPASQASKLPVLRQRGAASAGSDSAASASTAAPIKPKIRCLIAAPVLRVLPTVRFDLLSSSS
jgi:hypothetical protein